MLIKVVLNVCALISVSNCWPFGIGNSFDPDVDLCNDPLFSGGVVAEDGETYLFKGDYYWHTRPLTKDSGIVGYANPTKSKWPEITDQIRLVFTISKNSALMTIFVVKNNWFGYQRGLKTMDGSTDSWPEFSRLKVTTAMTPTFGGNLVYILHSDNTYYTLYDFTNLAKPKIVRSGRATIRSNYLVFTEESAQTMPGLSLKSLINVRAALTYKEKMFLLSRENFCSINLIAQSYERECNTQDLNELIGCPLDINRRPSTTISTTPTTMKMTTTPTTALITTSTKVVTKGEATVHNVSDEELFPSDWGLFESSSLSAHDEVIQTGIPILGHELDEEEEEELSDSNTTPLLAAGIETAIFESNEQNAGFWAIAVVIGLILIALTSIIVFFVVTKASTKKKPNGGVLINTG